MQRSSKRAAATGAVVAMVISGAALVGVPGAQADDVSRQIAGTWRVTVQPSSGPSTAPFESIIAYTSSGSVIEVTSRAPASSGLGSWERLGSGRYATTFEKYRFSGTNYLGKTVIEEVSEVSPDGSRYTATATSTFLNSDGTRQVLSSTAVGERM
ncbi:MAG TPA: hypothetical protein VMZ11_10190 [Mycobacteriales bacterium]|nr:hypothetical protein [Mycobacteriales bacterium]